MKIIVCFNQVTYTLAHHLANNSSERVILIITPERVSTYADSPVTTYRFRRWLMVGAMLLAILTTRVELVFPHFKFEGLGNIVKKSAQYVKRLSFIDDGMDTFRDKPKNIDVDAVRDGATYYSFDYPIPVATWLSRCQVIPLCGIESLAHDIKPALDLRGVDCLVIESPGVDLASDFSTCERAFYIRHPNHYKQNGEISDLDSENGANISVEKTLNEFDGSVVVGESMVMIYALLTSDDRFSVKVMLNEQQYKNLSALHHLISDDLILVS